MKLYGLLWIQRGLLVENWCLEWVCAGEFGAVIDQLFKWYDHLAQDLGKEASIVLDRGHQHLGPNHLKRCEGISVLNLQNQY